MKKYAQYDRVPIDSIVEKLLSMLALIVPIAALKSTVTTIILYQIVNPHQTISLAVYVLVWIVTTLAFTQLLFGIMIDMALAVASLDSDKIAKESYLMSRVSQMIKASKED